MEYGKLVFDRYSCRKLTDAPVEQEKIDYNYKVCYIGADGCELPAGAHLGG